jgi:hypothetical protein
MNAGQLERACGPVLGAGVVALAAALPQREAGRGAREREVNDPPPDRGDPEHHRLGFVARVIDTLDAVDEQPQRVAQQAQRDQCEQHPAERGLQHLVERAVRVDIRTTAGTEREAGSERTDQHVEHTLHGVTEAREALDPRSCLVKHGWHRYGRHIDPTMQSACARKNSDELCSRR